MKFNNSLKNILQLTLFHFNLLIFTIAVKSLNKTKITKEKYYILINWLLYNSHLLPRAMANISIILRNNWTIVP